jgi:hypothetical protein
VGSYEHENSSLGSVRGREFLEQLCNYQSQAGLCSVELGSYLTRFVLFCLACSVMDRQCT